MPLDFAILERIGGRSAIHPDEGPPTSVIESVRQYLTILLNTRRGQVAILPDFGLPDLSEIYKTYPGSLATLGRTIRETITKYEPRIQNLEVNLVSSSDSTFEVYFSIKGTLIYPDGNTEKISLQTIVSNNGHVKLI